MESDSTMPLELKKEEHGDTVDANSSKQSKGPGPEETDTSIRYFMSNEFLQCQDRVCEQKWAVGHRPPPNS